MKFYWHIHHKILMEPALDPIKNRIEYIKTNKPAHEIETRLRLLKLVKGELPIAVVEAWKNYSKAEEACDKAQEACDTAENARDAAWDAFDKARDTLDKAFTAHKPEIEALHRKECPGCPWDGETIFP